MSYTYYYVNQYGVIIDQSNSVETITGATEIPASVYGSPGEGEGFIFQTSAEGLLINGETGSPVIDYKYGQEVLI